MGSIAKPSSALGKVLVQRLLFWYPMQMYDAIVLQELWKRKGKPPCEHPTLDREYSLGAYTGELVCTTCGAYATTNGTAATILQSRS
jgi:hypothetical protein